MDITWHTDFASQWLDREQQGRLPHAVLLTGPRGIGKRAAAAWMVARKLDMQTAGNLPQHPFERPQHADLRWLEKPEDKRSIIIDQVRELVQDLALTSYEGHGKAAVIDPANILTNEAANSLLKTLEEPPGDTLLILIADRVGRLPATIFSRCQRIELRIPAEQEGLAWLDKLHPGGNWREPLHIAGLAPIGAVDAAASLETSTAMKLDFAGVSSGQVSPLEVAARWAKIEPVFVLDWLSRQVQSAILAVFADAGSSQGATIGDSALQRIDRRNLFCYLDRIDRLRGQPDGSWNVQLTFEGLLIDWATGLTLKVNE